MFQGPGLQGYRTILPWDLLFIIHVSLGIWWLTGYTFVAAEGRFGLIL